MYLHFNMSQSQLPMTRLHATTNRCRPPPPARLFPKWRLILTLLPIYYSTSKGRHGPSTDPNGIKGRIQEAVFDQVRQLVYRCNSKYGHRLPGVRYM